MGIFRAIGQFCMSFLYMFINLFSAIGSVVEESSEIMEETSKDWKCERELNKENKILRVATDTLEDRMRIRIQFLQNVEKWEKHKYASKLHNNNTQNIYDEYDECIKDAKKIFKKK